MFGSYDQYLVRGLITFIRCEVSIVIYALTSIEQSFECSRVEIILTIPLCLEILYLALFEFTILNCVHKSTTYQHNMRSSRTDQLSQTEWLALNSRLRGSVDAPKERPLATRSHGAQIRYLSFPWQSRTVFAALLFALSEASRKSCGRDSICEAKDFSLQWQLCL